MNKAIDKCEEACSLYCKWYDTGVPQLSVEHISYELVSYIREILAILKDSEK